VVAPDRRFRGHHRLGIDTNILIYLVQNHPQYGEKCASLFERIERGSCSAVTSTFSMLEVLVNPYRLNDDYLVKKFYALLSTYPGLEWFPVSLEVADCAAELRARYRLSTPDAIQVATAMKWQATGFVGNDKGLRKVKEIECLTIADIV